VRQGARVEATDGRVGRLDEFLVDPANEHVTHLVMREGHLWGRRDVTIPVSEIDLIEEDTIYLKLDKEQVGALPTVPSGLR
jgi:sporulation protein YlmC with PRC-barrel domain